MKKYLLFLPVLFISCLPTELDNLDSFEYSFGEFEIVPEVPEVELPEVEEVPTESGTVKPSEKAENLVTNVEEAIVNNNLTPENLELIDKFAAAGGGDISDEEIISEVTDEWIEGVFNGDVEPSNDLKNITDEILTNDEFTGLFSEIEFPKVDGVEVRGRMLIDGIIPDVLLPREVQAINQTSSLVTPCKEAAESVFNRNVAEINRLTDLQKASVRANYEPEIAFYRGPWLDGVIEQGQITYNEILSGLLTFAFRLNSSIDRLNYPTPVKRGLKAYLAAFVIQAINELNQWQISYNQAAELASEQNVNRVLNLILTKENELEANRLSLIAAQQALLTSALNNCHDQGAGG